VVATRESRLVQAAGKVFDQNGESRPGQGLPNPVFLLAQRSALALLVYMVHKELRKCVLRHRSFFQSAQPDGLARSLRILMRGAPQQLFGPVQFSLVKTLATPATQRHAVRFA